MSIRVAFVGAGLIARSHARGVVESGTGARIVAVVDPDVDRGERFAADHGAAHTGLVDALDEADAVYVCTWTSAHPEAVAAAADRGMAVFCEKPLGIDLATAAAMTDRVVAAGVTNQVGLVLRDVAPWLVARSWLADPDLGRVMAVTFRDDQYLPTRGFYASTWRGDAALAGSGTLLEHSIHDVDLIEWLVGPIATVRAATRAFHGLDGIEDVATALFELEHGGLATLTSAWHDNDDRPNNRRFDVLCENGQVVIDDAGSVTRQLSGRPPQQLAGAALGRAAGQLAPARGDPDRRFLHRVAERAPSEPDFTAALRAHLVIDAAYRAAADGSTVTIRPTA